MQWTAKHTEQDLQPFLNACILLDSYMYMDIGTAAH